MLYRIFAVSTFAVLLAGCAATPAKPIILPKPTLQAPPTDLMTPCADLPQFKSDSNDTSDLVGYNISLIQSYGHCSVKLKKLQAWVNKQINPPASTNS